MKLLIAIPTHDYMHMDFVNSLMALTKKLNEEGIDYHVKLHGGTLVYHGRDALAKLAIEGGFTDVLWLDADMVFQDTIVEDLQFSGKPFVSGIAHGRRPPHQSCLFSEIFPGIQRFTEYPTDTFRVAGCGFGCVLIKTEILKVVRERHGTCFFPTMELGEDLAFCKKATDAGYEIWAEPSVRLGHIGHIAIYPEYRDQYVNSFENPEVLRNAR
jgi:hypothetical protein